MPGGHLFATRECPLLTQSGHENYHRTLEMGARNFSARKRFCFARLASFLGNARSARMNNPSRSINQRRLSPLGIENCTGNCWRHRLHERYGGHLVRANQTYPRSRQISGQSQRRSAVLGLRSVRGTSFLQGRRGSSRREWVVPALHSQASLGFISPAARDAARQRRCALHLGPNTQE